MRGLRGYIGYDVFVRLSTWGRRMNRSAGWLLFAALIVGVSLPHANGAEPPSEPQSSESPVSSERDLGRLDATAKALGERVEKLTTKVEDSDKNLQDAKNNLYILATLLGVGLVSLIAYARAQVRERFQEIADQSKNNLIEVKAEFVKSLELTLNERLSRLDLDVAAAIVAAAAKTEASAYLYMHVASLRYAQKYDEALEVAKWSGDPKSYEHFPEHAQRHLITCLTKAHKVRDNGDHLKAWDWVTALMKRNPSGENVEAMLRTAKELRHASDAVTLYDSVSERLTSNEQTRCEQFLIVILRKSQGNSLLKARLFQLAEKHRHSPDIRTQTTIAAVYRDEGLFEDADSIMRPAIKKLTGLRPTQEGWDKLFNTYIANCIDLDKPVEAVPQVKTLLAGFHRPDHVFNCSRVAWRLPESHESREELFRLIRNRFADGLMPEKDDGTVKTHALLKQLDGKPEEAEQILQNAIDDMANLGNSAWARDQAYYYRCYLAELQIARNDRASLDRAVDALAEVVKTDRAGEASYLMAKAMIRKGEIEPALQSLEAAAKLKQKWIKRAKRDTDFERVPETHHLVSRYTAPLQAR